MAAEPFRDNAGEILRQASVALDGRPVTLWEVGDGPTLLPRASSDPQPRHHFTSVDLDSTLRRWGVPIQLGSRWLGCRLSLDGPWVIAPVRVRPPAPPPGGVERRSPTRLTLELAGLALGLSDRRETPALGRAGFFSADPIQDLLTLPSVIAHEAKNPLSAARAGLQLTMDAVGHMEDISGPRRLELLQELGEVQDALTRALDFLQAVQDRGRGATRERQRFDAVRVARSVVALEGRVLHQRGITLELASSIENLHLNGDPNLFYELLMNLVRNAGEASAGRPGPITVRIGKDGETLRLAVEDHGIGIAPHLIDRVFEPGFTTKAHGEGVGAGLAVVRRVAHNVFGGSVSVKSTVGVGTTFTIALPVPLQRGSVPPVTPSDRSGPA